MVTTQPFLIKGIDDADEARASAIGACAMFIFTFILSALGIWYDSQNKSEPEVANNENGNGEYQLQTEENFPNYGTSS
jgi:hypothetical protein